MSNKAAFLLFSALFVCAPSWAFSLSGFEAPESVAVDPEDGAYYVSNMNGELLAKDGNGYISKISANGNTVIQKYIGGKADTPVLDAPKGLAILGKRIFVTDIDTVKIFDKETHKLLDLLDFTPFNAKFLNDLAFDAQEQVMYVSDLLGNTIYQIDVHSLKITVFKAGEELGQPNGLVFSTKTKNLIVVAYGQGHILEISRAGKMRVLKKGLKALDGVDYDHDGNLYVSSLENGEIYQISRSGRGTITTFLSGLNTPADIAYDRNKEEILIPSTMGNTVSTSGKKPLRTS